MTFLSPLDPLIPKIPFSFFAEIWVRVTFGAWGSIPPPPPAKARLPKGQAHTHQRGAVQIPCALRSFSGRLFYSSFCCFSPRTLLHSLDLTRQLVYTGPPPKKQKQVPQSLVRPG